MSTIRADGTTTRACQNCGTPMLGAHCYACGQPVNGLVRHFGSIVGDFLDSVFDLDSRIFRTLPPLLFRPGYLSREYFAGHRVRYVSPVRLFVFLCLAAFFVLRFFVEPEFDAQDNTSSRITQAHTIAEVERARDEALATLHKALERVDSPGGQFGLESGIAEVQRRAEARIEWLKARDAALARGETPPPEPRAKLGIQINNEQWDPQTNPVNLAFLPAAANTLLNNLARRADANIRRVRDEPALLVDAYMQSLPATFFVLLPVFALLLKIAYLFRRRLYMEHLIVALHSHAFLCAALLLIVGFEEARDWLGAGAAAQSLQFLEMALMVWMPLYLWLTQKRVYGQGVIMTSLKFGVLGLCYFALLSLGAFINLAVSLVAL